MQSPTAEVVEIIVAGLVLLVLLLVLFVYARRRLISHEGDVVMCGYRSDRAARWRPALLRMNATTLQVFPLFGWTLRPARTWERRTIDIGAISMLEEDAGLASVIDLQGRGRRVRTVGTTEAGTTMTFDLALGPVQYTALRYWVESAPPVPDWPL